MLYRKNSKLNSVAIFGLSNGKSINNKKNKNNNIALKNKDLKKKNLVFNSYNFYKKGNNISKDKNKRNNWEKNILNLITKENIENNRSSNTGKSSKGKIKKKFIFNDSFTENRVKQKPEQHTKLNSNKNFGTKYRHEKLDSTDLVLNKLNRNKNAAMARNKERIKKISMTTSNYSRQKIKVIKSNNISSSSIKDDKSFFKDKAEEIEKIEKLEKNKKKQKKVNFKLYYGPIDIGMISYKNREESINDIIKTMNEIYFECQIINDTLIRCFKKGILLEIEIVKIKGNLLYYLAKNIK